MRSSLKGLTVLAVLGMTMADTCAEVRLPALFSDNMVVQQKISIPVWGWAAPGEQVTVTLGASQAMSTADAQGKWLVRLEPLPAGGPLELVVSGNNTLTIKNVLVGEVYLASGQSNMELTVRSTRDAEREIAAADHPNLRMFTVQKSIAIAPQTDCRGSWAVCSPATVPAFSAVGYFFALSLQKALNVPIGIIHTSWGGTAIEPWTDRQSLLEEPTLKPLADAADRQSIPPNQPGPGTPTVLYNAMVAPLVPYGIAGVIWYQGESNARNPTLYRTQFPALIKGWRRVWGQGDFPFFWV